MGTRKFIKKNKKSLVVLKKVLSLYQTKQLILKTNIMKTYTYRVTDNNFYNAFETNSYYDAMAEVTERLEGSKMVATILDKTTGTKKAYRWDANNDVIANY